MKLTKYNDTSLKGWLASGMLLTTIYWIYLVCTHSNIRNLWLGTEL